MVPPISLYYFFVSRFYQSGLRQVCEETWAAPSVDERCGKGEKEGMTEIPRGWRRRSDIGHLCKRRMSHSAHSWKRFIQKLLQAAQGLGFFLGGGWQG